MVETSHAPPRSYGLVYWITRAALTPESIVWLWFAIAIFASGWVSISLPDRGFAGVNVGIDVIAFLKLVTRFVIIAGAAMVFWNLYWVRACRLRHQFTTRDDTATRTIQLAMEELEFSIRRSNRILWIMSPWLIFLGWAFLSSLWSPLRAISIGQSISLASMFALMWATALFCDRPERRERMLFSIHWMLLGYCTFVLVCHFFVPELTGLGRDTTAGPGDGLVHPTAAGATASLGLVLSVMYWLRVDRPPTCFAFRYGTGICSVLLLASHSRAALGMGVLAAVIAMVWLLPSRKKGVLLCGSALVFFGLVAFDPGFEALEGTFGKVGNFLARGQTQDQLKNVSGRAELWAEIWREFQESIWVGHGYFVTSSEGKLDVWYEPTNFSAHHVVLQLLVTTGLIGTAIFSIGAFVITVQVIRGKTFRWPVDIFIFRLSIILAIWFGGWAMTCESFLGPVRPEVVLFYVLVGLLLAASLQDEPKKSESVATSL